MGISIQIFHLLFYHWVHVHLEKEKKTGILTTLRLSVFHSLRCILLDTYLLIKILCCNISLIVLINVLICSDKGKNCQYPPLVTL